jgi:alpha-glucosidase (family GH31 glycosyl hydrolase)
MGFHAASYAYNSLDKIKNNVANYSSEGIPLDGVWFDIPYMKNYEDFSVDNAAGAAFEGTAEYVQELRTTMGKKVVPIIDAGL